jgi:chromodomain-helicase-DNA-binding protein 7
LEKKKEEDLEGLPEREYLVLWAGRPYADATWETESSVKKRSTRKEEDAQVEIDRFYRFSKRAEAATEVRPKTEKVDAGELEQTIADLTFPGKRALRPFQTAGVQWLCFNWHNSRNSILADEMGLGKTVQSVAMCKYLNDVQGIRGPFLVVAPLSTIAQWRREFEAWTDLNCVCLHGNKASRRLIQEYEWYGSDLETGVGRGSTRNDSKSLRFDVVVTTYEILLANAALLSSINWQLLVVDEAHRLQSANSSMTTTLRQEFNFEHCVLVTGTPIQNNILELWNLLSFLAPHKFDDWEGFEEDFGNMTTSEQVMSLHSLLKPFVLRRMKFDVEKKLDWPRKNRRLNLTQQ